MRELEERQAKRAREVAEEDGERDQSETKKVGSGEAVGEEYGEGRDLTVGERAGSSGVRPVR